MELTTAFLNLFFWSIYLVSPILLLMLAAIFILGQAAGRVEKWKPLDALYWSFVTATTLGYGDYVPKKRLSKALSIFIAFIGLMFTGIIIAVTLNTTSVVLDKYANKSVIEKLKSDFK